MYYIYKKALVCACGCIHVGDECICACWYIRVCIYIRMYIYICVHLRVNNGMFQCVYIYVCVHVYT